MSKENLTQEAFDAINAENQKLKKELKAAKKESRDLIEAHNKTLQDLRKKVQHGGSIAIRPQEPIDGKYTAKYLHPQSGKEIVRTVKFQDGHLRVRLANGDLVSSAALMRIAEGGEPNENELASFPALSALTQEAAAERLTDLVKMGYPHLVDVK